LSRFSSRFGGDVFELSSTQEGVVLVVVVFAVVVGMVRLLSGAACKDPTDAQGVFGASVIRRMLNVFV
jgi:hypothetical protein